MQITSIEPIIWKTMTPAEGELPCFCCHGDGGNATFFVHAEIDGTDAHSLKLPVCGKCAEYARLNPTWLEEMLFARRAKALSKRMEREPETIPAMDAGF